MCMTTTQHQIKAIESNSGRKKTVRQQRTAADESSSKQQQRTVVEDSSRGQGSRGRGKERERERVIRLENISGRVMKMLAISWICSGRVCAHKFDHVSLIYRFLEH